MHSNGDAARGRGLGALVESRLAVEVAVWTFDRLSKAGSVTTEPLVQGSDGERGRHSKRHSWDRVPTPQGGRQWHASMICGVYGPPSAPERIRSDSPSLPVAALRGRDLLERGFSDHRARKGRLQQDDGREQRPTPVDRLSRPQRDDFGMRVRGGGPLVVAEPTNLGLALDLRGANAI